MTGRDVMGPVRGGDRVSLLDAMRGVALLGIMFVNMTWFTGFAVLSAEQRQGLRLPDADAVVAWLVHFAVDSKFWSLFALLFGVGFALQCGRATRAGDAFAGRFVRRMMVLLVIGLGHAALIWFGDIVSIYAVIALALLVFRRCRDTTLLVWALLLLLTPLVLNGVSLLVDVATRAADAPPVDQGHGPAALFVIFATGSYLEVLQANWVFLVERWVLALYTGRFATVLGMFLLGVYAGRRGILRDPDAHRTLLRRVLVWGLVVGVPANALLATYVVPLRPPSGAGWVMTIVRSIGTPALCLAYASALAILFTHLTPRRLLMPFADVGRLSLTNYIGQSVFGVALFYGYGGYGLGAWGTVGITESVLLIAVVFGGQMLASAWWLRRFEQGPLEWLWRCVTYGRPLPLRRDRATLRRHSFSTNG